MNITKLIFVFWTLLLPALTTSSDDNPYKEFVRQLNGVRSKFARDQKINSMYKLYWSDDLAKVVFESEAPGLIFSIAAGDTVDSKIRDISGAAYTFMAENRDWTIYPLLIAMGAHQKEIGCVKQNGFDYCRVGPEKKFELKEYIGSKVTCETGYEKRQYLCDKVGFKEDFLSRLNAMRRKCARKYNVSNMHELVWSDSLADMSFNMPYVTDYRKIQLNDFYLNEDDLEAEVEKVLNRRSSRNENVYVELMTPLQEIFGCHWNPSKELYDCVIGHRKSVDFWSLGGKFIGPPGSECSYGYVNHYGLCKMISGNEEIALESVNAVRRSAASGFSIRNMNALIWDEALVNFTKSLKIEDHTLTVKPNDTWNYFVFHSFVDVRPKLYNDFYALVLGRDKALTVKRNSLHFLDPLQKRIGCATMSLDHGGATRYLCVIGPHGKSAILEKGDPDSKCEEGYVTDNGLCMDLGDRTQFLEAIKRCSTNLSSVRRHTKIQLVQID